MSELPELTDGHKATILLRWDKIDLAELAREVSGNPELDGRSLWAKAIKIFLNSKGLEAKTTAKEKIAPIILTEEQTDFCDNNADKMKTTELVRVLFKDDKLTPLSREFRAVYAYLNQTNKHAVKIEDEPVPEDDYKVPRSLYALILRVNRFVPNPKDPTVSIYSLEIKSLPPKDEKELRMLLGYVNLPRFEYYMNQYKKQVYRDLFEGTFLGMTYNKPDLSWEEQEQYINLASEIVQTAMIERQIQRLEQDMEESASGESDKKLTMTMVELTNSLREKFDKSKERQKKLFDTLSGSRAERLSKKFTENASILNLVDAWRDETKRNDMLALAELQKKAEGEDIDRLTSMESVMVLVAGMTKEEALN